MPNKKYSVIFSDRTASMFLNHIRFQARVSAEAAKKLHKEIIVEAKALEFMPESYPRPTCDEITTGKYRKKLVFKRYLLIYQIKDDKVYVDYVLDCGQGYEWLL